MRKMSDTEKKQASVSFYKMMIGWNSGVLTDWPGNQCVAGPL